MSKKHHDQAGIDSLGEEGRRLFETVTAQWTFDNAAEEAWAIVACRARDTEASLMKAIAEEGESIRVGERVYINPLLTELRHVRSTIQNWLASFKIDGSTTVIGAGGNRTSMATHMKAKKAAEKRWHGEKEAL